MEQPNPSPPASPDSELARLRSAIADLQARVSALEHVTVPVAPPPSSANRESTESRFGLTLVNRVGAITLAIGIIFFFKYAVDNQWIGAAGRVVLGIVVGLLLIVSGDWLNRREQRVFSQGLAGCGLAALYISLYASYAFYTLLSQSIGFLALVAVSALAIGLSLRYRNSAIAALGFVAALLTPMLLHNAFADTLINSAYLLIVALTSVIVSVRERWSVLIPSIAALTIIAGLFLFEPKHATSFVTLSLCLAVIYWAAALRSRRIPRVVDLLYVVGHACLALAVLRLLASWVSNHASPADYDSVLSELGSVFLALYGIVSLAYGIVRRSVVNRGLGLVLLGIVIAKLYLWDVWLLSRSYRITAFVALGALLLVASYIYSRFKLRGGV